MAHQLSHTSGVAARFFSRCSASRRHSTARPAAGGSRPSGRRWSRCPHAGGSPSPRCLATRSLGFGDVEHYAATKTTPSNDATPNERTLIAFAFVLTTAAATHFFVDCAVVVAVSAGGRVVFVGSAQKRYAKQRPCAAGWTR